MVQESGDLLMKRLLLFAMALTAVSCASAARLPITVLMESPDKYDGKTVVVTAYIQSAGPHGTFLTDDPLDPEVVMSIRVERPRDSIKGLREATTMMIEDEGREIARGVKGEFTGVLRSAAVRPPVLVLGSVRNVRWGTASP